MGVGMHCFYLWNLKNLIMKIIDYLEKENFNPLMEVEDEKGIAVPQLHELIESCIEAINKNCAIPDVSDLLPSLESNLARKTLFLVLKDSQNNIEAERLKSDIQILTSTINTIKNSDR